MNAKSISTIVIDTILITLLVPATLWCLVGSFNLKAGLDAVVVSAGSAALLSSLACTQIKNGKNALAAAAVTFVALLFLLLLETNTIINQLEYVLNRILFRYSEYLPLPQSISIGTGSEVEATLLLCFLEFILIFIFTFCVLKLRTVLPVLIISIAFIVPCFILVNTCPDIFPLFIVIAALAVLLITSELRRHSIAHCGAISAVSFIVVLCILGSVYLFNPADSFKREPWQDELLINLRQAVGLNFDDKSQQDGDTSAKIAVKQVNLSDAGPIEQTHEVVMQVYTDYEQPLYLRGTAYANYENNTWSTLTEEQYMECPNNGSWNPFYYSSISSKEISIEIVTKEKEEIVYVPYYLCGKPEDTSMYADIYLYNQAGKTTHTLDYRTSPLEEIDYGFDYSSDSSKSYEAFAYENYTQIPDELGEELRNILWERNNGNVLADISTTYDLIEKIRAFVSTSAEYSLNTPPVPEGEDIASYLLRDDGMDTAYCVHFATAAVLLMRSYGIPSRYVTGYYLNTSADMPYTTITTDNAHAWAEYFVTGIGWVPLEATPASFTPTITVADPIEDETKPTEIQTETQRETTQPMPSAVFITKEETADYTGLILIVFIAVATVGLVALRCVIVRAIRRRRFKKGGRNKRAIYIYRYIERCAKRLKKSVPSEIYDIGAKASFSRRKVTPDELKTLLNFAEKCRNELYKNSSAIKRFYYNIIVIL